MDAPITFQEIAISNYDSELQPFESSLPFAYQNAVTKKAYAMNTIERFTRVLPKVHMSDLLHQLGWAWLAQTAMSAARVSNQTYLLEAQTRCCFTVDEKKVFPNTNGRLSETLYTLLYAEILNRSLNDQSLYLFLGQTGCGNIGMTVMFEDWEAVLCEYPRHDGARPWLCNWLNIFDISRVWDTPISYNTWMDLTSSSVASLEQCIYNDGLKFSLEPSCKNIS